MPSDLERIIKTSKRLEALLADLGATGKGLHEKASSIERDLDAGLVRDIRAVATVRNKLVHEEGFDKIDNRSDLLARADRAEKALTRLARPKSRGPSPAKLTLAVVVLAALAGGAYFIARLTGLI